MAAATSSRKLMLPVSPGVLAWARETMGYSLDEAAVKLKVAPELLAHWEAALSRPPMSKAKKMAKLYRRPLIALMLPAPPEEPAGPPDFRTLPGSSPSARAFSPDLRLAIRQAHLRQEVAMELAEELGYAATVSLPKLTQERTPEQAAKAIRAKLGVPLEQQRLWRDHYAAYKAWRAAVEAHNILVCQFSSVALDEARAFSVAGPRYPVIALNAKDHPYARMFSLFHELGHVLLGGGGLCAWRREDAQQTERWCNRFAAEILVPGEALQALVAERGLPKSVTWEASEIGLLARGFAVSNSMMAIRLQEEDLADRAELAPLIAAWSAAGSSTPASGGGDYWRNLLSRESRLYLELLQEAVSSEHLSLHRATDYTGIRPAHWAQLQEKLGE